MAPVCTDSNLVRYVGHFVALGEFVFGYGSRTNQQPDCIMGKFYATFGLEDLPEQMGSASPLACCPPHDSLHVSNRRNAWQVAMLDPPVRLYR
jgi:hypothetical protein